MTYYQGKSALSIQLSEKKLQNILLDIRPKMSDSDNHDRKRIYPEGV